MDGMTSLVNDRCNIPHLAGSVHKNEGRTGFWERAMIPTRRFSLTTLKIEPVHFLHLLQAVGKKRIDLIEALKCFLQQLISCFEWSQRRNPFRFRIQIPWTKGIDIQFLFLFFIDLIYEGHYMLLYCLMKLKTILSCVVKAAKLFEPIFAIGGKARVQSNPVAPLHQRGEKLVQFFFILEPSFTDLAVYRFT